MAEVKIQVSDDRKQVSFKQQEHSQMSSLELEEYIRHLSMVRSQMFPPVNPAVNANTRFSAVESILWGVGVDENYPTAVVFCLMHPGFGWIKTHFTEEQAEGLVGALRNSMLQRPSIQ